MGISPSQCSLCDSRVAVICSLLAILLDANACSLQFCIQHSLLCFSHLGAYEEFATTLLASWRQGRHTMPSSCTPSDLTYSRTCSFFHWCGEVICVWLPLHSSQDFCCSGLTLKDCLCGLPLLLLDWLIATVQCSTYYYTCPVGKKYYFIILILYS